MNISNCKRILIVGDSGRGKSTLANALSEKLNIKHVELDDLFWIEKYTKRRTDEEHIALVKDILSKEKVWIIEGSTRHMVNLCLDDADYIINLVYKSIFSQWFYIIKRDIKRGSKLKQTFILCKHLFYNRYKLGYCKDKITIMEMLTGYDSKVIELKSWKEINCFLKDI